MASMKVLEFIGGLVLVLLMAYGKYWQLRSASDRKEEKADIETIFSGKH